MTIGDITLGDTTPGRITSSIDHYDVVVVGGGIHGVGVLQAAAAAGHTALLLEERTIAAGTSSKSSKLIHGGLRYLESGQLALVRESLRERQILCRIAPELVRLEAFHVPLYQTTSRTRATLRTGLGLYALLGGLRREALFSAVPRERWDALDGLRTDDLLAVFRYHDGATDDAALARAVARSASELGGEVRLGARFVSAVRDDTGYAVRYATTEREHTVHAHVLVNAAGAWVNRVRERIEPRMSGFDVEWIAGAHIELEGTLSQGIYYVEAPSDRRAVFALPWRGRTLVGTTETPYRDDPALVHATAAEIEYLRATFAHHFPKRSTDVVASWAGLRVLPRGEGRAFDRPRETTLVVDDERNPHALAIYGGKLTGYRATAEKVIARVKHSLPRRSERARTDELPLRADA